MKENKKKRPLFTTHCRQASMAGWTDYGTEIPKTELEKETAIKKLKTYIRWTKESATADDDVLDTLVSHYKYALEKGKRPKEAIADFYKAVEKGLKTKRVSQELYNVLEVAIWAGNIAEGLENEPIDDSVIRVVHKRVKRIEPINYIHAVQELVKANPLVLKLPFVQNIMINLLRRQKYAPGKMLTNLKKEWLGFLHDRPKGKILHSPQSLKRLRQTAEKLEGNLKVSYGRIAGAFNISEATIKKRISVKGRRIGRPRKDN